MATFGVNVAIVEGGKVLLTLREDFEVWCLPGGHVDAGESLAAAARREVEEEVGLVVRLDSLVGTYSRPNWRTGPAHVAVFRATRTDGELVPDPAEVLEAAWFDPAELPSDLLLGQRLRIRDAVTGRRGVVHTSGVSLGFAGVEELFRARDESELSRADFYDRHVVQPNAQLERDELDRYDLAG